MEQRPDVLYEDGRPPVIIRSRLSTAPRKDDERQSRHTFVYVDYPEPRPVKGYIGQAGNEINGQLVPWDVLDDHAEAVSRARRDMYVVTGEYTRDDGKRWLQFAVDPGWLIATSNYRWRRLPSGSVELHWLCPSCNLWGDHQKSCPETK